MHAPRMAVPRPALSSVRACMRHARHSIAEDCSWYFEQNYKAQGGLDKDVDFALDEALAALA